MRLQTRIILWMLGVIFLATTVTLALTMVTLAWRSRGAMERNLLEIADTVAGLAEVRSGLRGSPFDGVVQDRVLSISSSFSDVDSLIVCDQWLRYYSHPNVFMLGLAHDDPAARDAASGRRYVAAVGTADGEMIGAYVPVFDGGEQVGFVKAGATAKKLGEERARLFAASGIFLLVGMAVGAAGAVWQARRIKSVLLGLEPEEIAKLYREHAGMIEAMHEGVIAVNEHGVVTMSNESARKLLGMEAASPRDADIGEIMPETRISEAIRSGKPIFDYEHRVKDRVLIATIVPITDGARVVGAVETLQDRTQAVRLAEELTGVRQMVEALRASSHEFSNRMQAILGMLEMEDYDSAREFILGARNGRVGLERRLLHSFGNPMIAGLLLGKRSAAAERGVEFSVAPESRLGETGDPAVSHELVSIIGNLVDNAVESAQKNAARDGAVSLAVSDAGGDIAIRVEDNGEGIRPAAMESIFLRGVSTKGEGRGTGLYLVRRAVRLLGGTVRADSRPGSTVFSVVIPLRKGGAP